MPHLFRASPVKISNFLLLLTGERKMKGDLPPKEIHQIKLSDFADKRSLEFFKILEVDCQFLTSDPVAWDSFKSYSDAKRIACSFKSTNDIAERAVRVASDYNRVLTKSISEYEKICVNAYETRKSR